MGLLSQEVRQVAGVQIALLLMGGDAGEGHHHTASLLPIWARHFMVPDDVL